MANASEERKLRRRKYNQELRAVPQVRKAEPLTVTVGVGRREEP